jgi:hypothetical protein
VGNGVKVDLDVSFDDPSSSVKAYEREQGKLIVRMPMMRVMRAKVVLNVEL